MSNDEDITEPTRWLTAEDVAERVGFDLRVIHRFDSAGKMPVPIRNEELLLWRECDIEAWIAEGCQTPTQQNSVRTDVSSGAVDVARKLSSKARAKPSFYHLCLFCDAKFFTPNAKEICTRCGRVSTSNVIQTPPWQKDSNNQEGPLGAACGNTLPATQPTTTNFPKRES